MTFWQEVLVRVIAALIVIVIIFVAALCIEWWLYKRRYG